MVINAINKKEEKGNGFMVPIGVSARHIHLTQEHVEALFGSGYQLTKKKELMGGQFASNETVTIVGLKLRAIENVRCLLYTSSKIFRTYPLRLECFYCAFRNSGIFITQISDGSFLGELFWGDRKINIDKYIAKGYYDISIIPY